VPVGVVEGVPVGVAVGVPVGVPVAVADGELDGFGCPPCLCAARPVGWACFPCAIARLMIAGALRLWTVPPPAAGPSFAIALAA